MSEQVISPTAVPSLNRMFRLQWEQAQQGFVLLYPEGMVKLNGAAGEIMSLVDGQRSVSAIIEILREKFPSAQGIDQDICEFLVDAQQQLWLTFSD